MKKIISVLLVLSMLFTLASCSSGEAPSESKSDKSDENKSKDSEKVTVSLDIDLGEEAKETEKQEENKETEAETEKKEEISSPAEDKTENYLICAECSFEPFAFSYEDGKYTGFDIDILNEAAKYGGFNVYIQDESFSDGLAALAAGDYNGMISAITKTAERTQIYDYSDAYFTDGVAVVVNENSKIKDLYDLRDKKVGVVADSQGDYFASYDSEKYGYDLVTYSDYTSMYEALGKGSVDAVVEEFYFAAWRILNLDYQMTVLPEFLWEVNYYFIVPKGKNGELLRRFNEGLAEMRANGAYDEVLEKYGFNNIAK